MYLWLLLCSPHLNSVCCKSLWTFPTKTLKKTASVATHRYDDDDLLYQCHNTDAAGIPVSEWYSRKHGILHKLTSHSLHLKRVCLYEPLAVVRPLNLHRRHTFPWASAFMRWWGIAPSSLPNPHSHFSQPTGGINTFISLPVTCEAYKIGTLILRITNLSAVKTDNDPQRFNT